MNGSIHRWAVVNRPGTGSREHGRSHASPVPVLSPNSKGATTLEITRVFGTGNPNAAHTSKPNALSPMNRLKRLGHDGIPGLIFRFTRSISQMIVCSFRYPHLVG